MAQELDQALDELKLVLRKYRRLIVLGVVVFGGVSLIRTTFYTVKADEEGVVLRFGEHLKSTGPGLHTKLPWPIDQAIRVPIQRAQRLEFGFATLAAGRQSQYRQPSARDIDIARMLTGDLNLAHVEWIVQWRIHDAAKFLFTLGGARSQTEVVEDAIRDVSETVMRGLVGDVSVDEVLTTGRDRIAGDAKLLIQKYLDGFDCGVTIMTVKLQTVSPPEKVKDAFDSVNRARQRKEQVVNEARGERNRLVPAARGKRDRAIAESEGYKDRVVKTATGRANAFLSKLAEFRKAPEITRERLYLETMEEVLGQIDDIVVLDQSLNGILPLLDLQANTPLAATRKGGRP